MLTSLLPLSLTWANGKSEAQNPCGKCRLSPPGSTPLPAQRRQEVKELLSRIQPSSSPWAAPIVLVPKKNGNFHFCIYQRLNEVTRKDAYPLPQIDSNLDTLAGSKLFTTLDFLSRYWQVEVTEADRVKTAFCTTDGLYEFTAMPFSLCNAPATLKHLIDLILRGAKEVAVPSIVKMLSSPLRRSPQQSASRLPEAVPGWPVASAKEVCISPAPSQLPRTFHNV